MTTTNSINNTIKNNDYLVNLDTAGSASTSSVNHSDNTNTGSHAELRMETGGTSGGDPSIYFNVPSGADYSFGIDNSTTADDLVMTDSTSPSTANNIFRLYANGNRRLEKTPCVSFINTTASNVTGDGTTYTVSATTTYFDQNSDFNGTTTFTAPVTGKFLFSYGMSSLNWTNQTAQFGAIVTSNQTYNSMYYGFGEYGTSEQMNFNMAILADMDASDTATFQYTVSGGDKIIDLRTNFSPITILLAV